MATCVNTSTQQYFGFDPRTIPGCVLWHDATDTDTFTLSSGSVTAWRNKASTSGAVATANTSITLNANGLGTGYPALTFTNTQWLNGSVSITGTPSLSVFSVFSLSSSSQLTGRVLSLAATETADFNDTRYFAVLRRLEALMGPNRNFIRSPVVTPYDTRLLNTSVVDGATMFSRTNGGGEVSVTTTNTNFDVSAYRIGNSTQTGDVNAPFSGFIGEIITYNSALTPSERQQVEGYLAWKWGLQANLPSGPIPILPTDESGIALWIDAASNNIIWAPQETQFGIVYGGFARLFDRSGNGRDITTENNSSAPFPNYGGINNLPVISFNGSSTFLNTVDLYSQRSFAVFTVVRRQGAVNDQSPIIAGSAGFGSVNGNMHMTFTQNSGLRFGFFGNDLDFTAFPAYTGNSATEPAFLIAMVYTPGSRQIFVNGALVASDTNSTNLVSSAGMTLGWFPAVNRFFNGFMGEFIVYNVPSSFPTGARQRVEGYLAQKWGLRGTLPVSHPFSLSSIGNPSTISNLSLWLDSADRTTFTFPSGSNISQWRDKSVNAFHVGQGTSGNQPIYSLNGSNYYVDFRAANDNFLLRETPAVNIDYRNSQIFLVFRRKTLQTTNPGVFAALIPGRGNDDWQNTDEFVITTGTQVASAGTGVDDAQFGNLNLTAYSFVISNNYLTTFRDFGTSSVITRDMGLTANPQSIVLGTRRVGGARIPANILLGEVIVYNRLLTTTENQQIQNYLVSKWGIRVASPTHPFKGNPPTMRLFRPIDIEACALWLDAADLSVINPPNITSGTAITQWNDKSVTATFAIPERGPTANPIVFSNVGGVPSIFINNNNSVDYNANTFAQLTVQSNFQTTADYSVFAVVNLCNVAASPQLQTIYANRRSTSAIDGQTRAPQMSAGNTFETSASTAAFSPRQINVAFLGSGIQQTCLVSSPTLFSQNKNGSFYGESSSSFGNRWVTDAGAFPSIGGSVSTVDPRFATGHFHELIVYNKALTNAERQRVEGYLMEKWRTPALPVSHPFYISDSNIRAVPTTPVFTPTSISNCAFWIDATDSASVQLSGSNIVNIFDKSGNGYNLIGATGYTLTSNFNGSYPAFSSSPAQLDASGNSRIDVCGNSLGSNLSFNLTGTFTSFAVGANQRPGNLGYLYDGAIGEPARVAILDGGTMYNSGGGGYFSGTVNRRLANSPFVGTWVMNGANSFINMNGSRNGEGSLATGTFNGIIVGTRFSKDGINTWAPHLCELLIYNRVLTNEEIRRVEGYLAWKWGLQSIVSISSGTTPTRFGNPALWLDANDTSTLSLTGTTVTQWRDKSTNARHLNVGAGTTSYISNAVQLNSSYLFITSDVDLQNFSCFIVCESLTPTINQPVFTARPNAGESYGSPDGFSFYIDEINPAKGTRIYGNIFEGDVITTIPTPPGRFLTSFVGVSTGLISSFRDAKATGTMEALTRTTTARGFAVGAEWETGEYKKFTSTARIYEIIVYSIALPTNQRQQIEGYLLSKWNIPAAGFVLPPPLTSFRP